MTISKDEAGSKPGPISKDEAAEALVSIAASQSRLYDLSQRQELMPGFVASGFFGLVGFGLQSSLSELAFGAKILNGWSGVISLLGVMLVPVWFFHGKLRLIILKPASNYGFRFISWSTIGYPMLWLLQPGNSFDGTNVSAMPIFTANLMFGFGISQVLAAMLWLGRWYAYGALIIIVSIAMICVYEPNLDLRFTWLALLCGFGIFPTGLWMLMEERRNAR